MRSLPHCLAEGLLCLFLAVLLFPPQLLAQQQQQQQQKQQQQQQKETTITGCLTPGDRADLYTVREEGTGFSITVAGSADLKPASSNHKVRLTGRLVQEGGRDVFRVTRVEDLAPTCEPTFLAVSVQGMRDVVARATFGVNGGVGLDPELIYLGAQGQFGPIFRNLWFRPNFEYGFGELTDRVALNLEAVYFLPVIARGTRTGREDVWSIYLGGGPAFQLSHRNFEEQNVNIDFGDWDYDTGLNIVMGVIKRRGLFTELKAGVYGSPSLRVIVGYNFW